MPDISRRAQIQSDSPIRNLSPFAQEAKSRGVHVHHLNIGQPDIPTPPYALQALRDYPEKIIAYGKSEGEFLLRDTIAKYYRKFDSIIEAEDVMITCGASEAIQLLMHTCFDLGDELIVPEPFYANYLGYSEMCGLQIKTLDSNIESEFRLPSVADFEKKITPKTKAILLCNPGNPTGVLYPKEELVQLAELVKKYQIYLIVDEVYAEFCYDGIFTSAMSLLNVEEHVIVIASISKVFSSCGARVGYFITKNERLRNTVKKYAQIRLSAPMLGQHLAIACYQSFDEYFPPILEMYRKRRDTIYRCLSSMEGVRCYRPQAAFYNMVHLPIDNSYQFCKWLLQSFSHENETVMFAPGRGFYHDKDKGNQQVRIAFVLASDKIERAMECLQHALNKYPRS